MSRRLKGLEVSSLAVLAGLLLGPAAFAARSGAPVTPVSPVAVIDATRGVQVSQTGADLGFGDAPEHVDLDFGREIVGKVVVATRFPPRAVGLRIALSETERYLGFHSDYRGRSRTEATFRCGSHLRCSHFGAFRYARLFFSAGAGANVFTQVHAELESDAAPTIGSFRASDRMLSRIWAASAETVSLDVARFAAANSDPRGCGNSWLAGRVVLLDGAKRDRCPYVGDLAVSALSELLRSGDGSPVRNVLAGLAALQQPDGFVPAGFIHVPLRLIDYPAWWVVVLHDYVLYTGDVGFARRVWPTLIGVVDRWYPSMTDSTGLIRDPSRRNDYAFVARTGKVVTYYNALYVLALADAVDLGRWTGDNRRGMVWSARRRTLQLRINQLLWDDQAGAYVDALSGAVAHPLDGNALAVVTGTAGSVRGSKALAFLAMRLSRAWGTAMVDTKAWDEKRPSGFPPILFGLALMASAVLLRKRYRRVSVVAVVPTTLGLVLLAVGVGDVVQGRDASSARSFSERVYPFMSYFEIQARFAAGHPASGLHVLRKTWGSMIDEQGTPGTVWEWIPRRAEPGLLARSTSLAHGWSTGAVPLLTQRVLGIRPTSPGFRRFLVAPYVGSLRWARGRVPTPAGVITVSWRIDAGGRLRIAIRAPRGDLARVLIPRGREGLAFLNGRPCLADSTAKSLCVVGMRA